MTNIKKLETQYEKVNKQYEEIKVKRESEVEFFKTDVAQIRKKTRINDEYLHRLKTLIGKNPTRAVEMVKSQELDVEPIKSQLATLDAKLNTFKA